MFITVTKKYGFDYASKSFLEEDEELNSLINEKEEEEGLNDKKGELHISFPSDHKEMERISSEPPFERHSSNSSINRTPKEEEPLLSHQEKKALSKIAKRKSFPFSALLKKNLRLQKRQVGTNCCQIFTPILVLFILFIIKLVIKSEVGEDIYVSQVLF